MLWPKKNSYKEFDHEKKFLQLKNSPPHAPHDFSNDPSLIWRSWTNGPLLLDIPLLTWDEPWREHDFEYDSFENQKEPQATKNKTNHLQVSFYTQSTCKREKVNGKLWSSLHHTGPGPPTAYSDLITHPWLTC